MPTKMSQSSAINEAKAASQEKREPDVPQSNDATPENDSNQNVQYMGVLQ